jgi:hypothetical protein
MYFVRVLPLLKVALKRSRVCYLGILKDSIKLSQVAFCSAGILFAKNFFSKRPFFVPTALLKVVAAL